MKLPSFIYEKKLWKKEFRYVCGIDEVGRGCFAGPIVAGAVVWERNPKSQYQMSNLAQKRDSKIKIHDSKKLSAKQREIANKWIKENCLSWGIGEASSATINRVGIVPASRIAFRKAIADANERLARKKKGHIDFLLIDAFYVPNTKGLRRKNQLAIVKGDSKSVSIAAASIIAKVYRDSLMQKLGNKPRYKRYDWVNNKGYGTLKHRKALQKHGICGYHRKMFVNTYLSHENK